MAIHGRRWALALLPTLIVFGLGGTPAAGSAHAAEPLTTVADFAIESYLGRWYEVARLPNSFQDQCAGEVTADYASTADGGLLAVINTCRTADGGTDRVRGVARPVDDPAAARLEVTFVSVFGLPIWLTAGDYWVIGLDRDYRWAIVGTPDRDYGWILARQPMLDPSTLTYLARLLSEKGYDPCAFVMSETALAATPTRLCDL